MKKFLLAITATIMLATQANAALGSIELQCGPPKMLYGADDGDTNPVIATAVEHSWDDRSWRVFHQLRNGAVVSRQAQYGMTDTSALNAKTQWQGRLLRQPWLYMIGEIKQNKQTEQLYYHEWMYDTKRGNALVMQSMTTCTKRQQLPVPSAQAPAPTQQPSPQVAARTKDSVPIYSAYEGRGVRVDVLVGGEILRMQVDTGATSVVLTDAIARKLIKMGHATFIAKGTSELADGSKRETPYILIREFRIGNHTITNVRAMVVPDGAEMLLGFTVLDLIGPFTIDTRAGELVWHGKS